MAALQVSLSQTSRFAGQLPTLSVGSESRVPVNAQLGGLQTQLGWCTLFSIGLEAMVECLATLPAAPQRTDS